MVYIEKSEKSVQEVVNSIENIVSQYKFGVQHIHNVQKTLESKGIVLENECQILDICNPNIAEQFLKTDMSLSSIMPCKISVYKDEGVTTISMNSLVQLVDDINPEVIEIAKEAQEIMLKIIDEVK